MEDFPNDADLGASEPPRPTNHALGDEIVKRAQQRYSIEAERPSEREQALFFEQLPSPTLEELAACIEEMERESTRLGRTSN